MSIQSVNAWALLNEDEPKSAKYPKGVPYSDPASCWQQLLSNKVYQAVDMLFLAFVEVVPTTAAGAIHVVEGYTLQNGDVTHADGKTNADYMRLVIADAQTINPEIQFLVTVDYGRPDQFSKIFGGCTTKEEREAAATAFAKNAVAFFNEFDLDGLDVDWEGDIANGTSQEEFDALCAGIRSEFGSDFLFTLSPATTQLLTGSVVNSAVDFLNLQLYASWVNRQDYETLGIDRDKLQYGATFEDFEDREQTPHEVAQAAIGGGYTIITQWRLNSGNFEYEQASQIELYDLCKGQGGPDTR